MRSEGILADPALVRARAAPVRRSTGPLGIGLAGLGLAVVLAVSQGSVSIPVDTVLGLVLAKLGLTSGAASWPASYETILFQLRLPRVVLAALVGSALAVSGAAYQGVFRNPLADPYLIGVAAGAGLGATIALVLPYGTALASAGLVPALAFLGALGAVAAAYRLGRVGRTVPTTTLLLAGVAISYLASSGTSLLMTMSGEQLRAVFSWLLGSFALAGWRQVLVLLPYLALGLGLVFVHARLLNVLQLDEEQARQLGVDVERVKLLVLVGASLSTAAAVSVSGLIGFVGLVVPHVARLLVGPDYRALLPTCLAYGALALVLADLVARTVLAPIELPVGIITSFCGAPFFLYLLRGRKRMVM
ncbi:MAG: iron ABC transporter permease [Chloroflexi bacterium]|nr:iron ABC transporter permease [Chloroflexota bacterium]